MAIPLVFGPSNWMWLLPLLVLFLLPIIFAITPGVHLQLQEWSRRLVPEGIWSRLNDMQYIGQRSIASTRLSQWKVALQLILERPWLGWGAAAFSVIYPLRTGHWHGHAHNLPLEIALSHGWPAAAFVVSTVLILLIISLRLGILNAQTISDNGIKSSIFDRAWWASAFIVVGLHGTDMPFFDSRLNIAGWILLAGLRSMLFSAYGMKPIDQKLPGNAVSVALS